MKPGNLLVVTGNEISQLFYRKELEIMDSISRAYQAHGKGEDYLPQSIFLRFPNSEKNRIIGLPAYLGGEFQNSGMKWIASYPKNHEVGLDRASATIILNSFDTGIPIAILEGSVISAKRTAASAALAAKHLVSEENTEQLTLIGCGLINFETLRFVKSAIPTIRKVHIFDISQENSEAFAGKCLNVFPDIELEIINDIDTAMKSSKLISFATTSVKPHINTIENCQEGTTVLHISLRDFTADVMKSAVNIVDDVEHVCRAQTSIHLASQDVSKEKLIRCSLSEILLDKIEGRKNNKEKIIFSPFGLGILDIALSKFIYDTALDEKQGSVIESFLPTYWLDRK